MGFVATVAAVVTALEAGGVPAASAMADLNPPAVLVTPTALVSPTKLCGTGSLRMILDLTARDSGDASALAQLEDMYALVEPLFRRYSTGDPSTFTRAPVSADPTALPVLRIAIETPIVD